jgi:hypothetical protein
MAKGEWGFVTKLKLRSVTEFAERWSGGASPE